MKPHFHGQRGCSCLPALFDCFLLSYLFFSRNDGSQWLPFSRTYFPLWIQAGFRRFLVTTWKKPPSGPPWKRQCANNNNQRGAVLLPRPNVPFDRYPKSAFPRPIWSTLSIGNVAFVWKRILCTRMRCDCRVHTFFTLPAYEIGYNRIVPVPCAGMNYPRTMLRTKRDVSNA